jgi:hypothetical protein
MNQGPIDVESNTPVDAESIAKVPGIAYTVPDLDARVQVYFNDSVTGLSLACVEAELSNGKTVDQRGVAWVVAVISGLALVASAITSGLGHSNTAAHVAANALSLFSYFQAQAFIGMSAVPLPPIVSAWTQNFQWSMGIINVGFLQDVATWYQRSTGGTPSLIISNLDNVSVEVQKRGLEGVGQIVQRSVSHLVSRAANSGITPPTIVKGIKRVGFRAGIEPTNIFLTGYIFFLIFVMFTAVGVLLFKLIVEGLVKSGHLKSDKFQDFRNGWTTVLKGIMFRIVLIGYTQMVVLCFWEFTQKDSGGAMVLAVVTIFTMIGILAWAASKVIRLAQRSILMHKNPAYILYSDPVSLNKWGFLYVQFKATAYYFIVPVLIYLMIKGLFIALVQENGIVQAIALVIIEAVFLIVVSVLRPYMDKKTNAFNIAICAINFISSILLLIFTHIFGQPVCIISLSSFGARKLTIVQGIVTGVLGVIFFVLNAVFATVLLVMVLVSSIIAITSKNPETRYQPMRDDRGSFIKSQSNINTELDALGATARGESKHGWPTTSGTREIDDDDSWSGNSTEMKPTATATTRSYYEPPRSPIQPPAAGGLPSSNNGSARHLPPNRGDTISPYGRPEANGQHRFRGPPQPAQQSGGSYISQSNTGRGSPSPWQRGAGFE